MVTGIQAYDDPQEPVLIPRPTDAEYECSLPVFIS